MGRPAKWRMSPNQEKREAHEAKCDALRMEYLGMAEALVDKCEERPELRDRLEEMALQFIRMASRVSEVKTLLMQAYRDY